MGKNGWSYLVVERPAGPVPDDPNPEVPPFRTRDGYGFSTEPEMFRELGTTGWELVAIRDEHGSVRYYFKRPRT